MMQGRERFRFGANWERFLSVLNEERIQTARDSLQRMLGESALTGKRFLDIGCGSGLFSLAARQLGATVTSFDVDQQSVGCARKLRQLYCPGDSAWAVDEASVLDRRYLKGLGEFDVVYSWGVLHHTGAMWQALSNVLPLVRPNGKLFIAVYNDQGGASRRWRLIKKLYNRLPAFGRWAVLLPVLAFVEARSLAIHMVRLDLAGYFRYRLHYAATSQRGMSYWHDQVDWVGGYPFEVAKPEEIFDFCAARGFELRRLKTCMNGSGCNEYVFLKRPGDHAS